MPHATVFDTHAAVKRPQAAGVDEPQAEAIVDTLQGAVTSHVATKSNLDNLRTADHDQALRGGRRRDRLGGRFGEGPRLPHRLRAARPPGAAVNPRVREAAFQARGAMVVQAATTAGTARQPRHGEHPRDPCRRPGRRLPSRGSTGRPHLAIDRCEVRTGGAHTDERTPEEAS